ncbi:MAG TPA: hypothetical protein VK614_13280 [Allosphingosinicella sp.]|nr:hypothetical protein [Allosphingosinicella sp.]
MSLFQRWALALLLLLSVSVAADIPAAAQPAASAAAAPAQPGGSGALRAWWVDQRWRYRTNEEAEGAYRALVARESPWPEWHQVSVVTLPAGLRFQMALAPGQPTDRPGGFGTFDRIPNVEFVRLSLAVKMAWKPAIDRVVTYEITTPLPADVGTVGPQIDVPADRYLPGGGSQFQMMIPAAERIQHLRVVEVRPIR